jgi:hypothetical protein
MQDFGLAIQLMRLVGIGFDGAVETHGFVTALDARAGNLHSFGSFGR